MPSPALIRRLTLAAGGLALAALAGIGIWRTLPARAA